MATVRVAFFLMYYILYVIKVTNRMIVSGFRGFKVVFREIIWIVL